jgi:hypothetical protein
LLDSLDITAPQDLRSIGQVLSGRHMELLPHLLLIF